MRPESYKLFAQVCEALTEASTTMDLVRRRPGGPDVVKALHQQKGLGHDLEFRPIGKISWSELKDSYNGKWVVVIGPKGVGAIKAISDSYQAMACTGEGVELFNNDRGGNILDFLKAKIGSLNQLYVAADTGEVKSKQEKRAEYKKSKGPGKVNTGTLVQKFKPLWERAITAAIADIKGHIANMISNDSFDKAKVKLEVVNELRRGLDSFEMSGEVPRYLDKAVSLAIMMAASHYYPEDTGEISKSYSGYSTERSEGREKLLSDIAQGDSQKLGTVLTFFKRALITG